MAVNRYNRGTEKNRLDKERKKLIEAERQGATERNSDRKRV